MGKGIAKRIFKGDKIIWIIFFLLCALSLVEVFSAISRQTYKAHNHWQLITQHAIFLLGGAGVAWFIHHMKISWIKRFTYTVYVLGIVLLVYALFFGDAVNDSARWVSIFGVRFQPLEIAKMGIVMTTSQVLAQAQTEEGTDLGAMKKILWLCAIPSIFILMENLSTVVIIMFTVFLMMIIGKVYWKHLLSLIGVGVGVVAILAMSLILTPNKVTASQGSWEHKIHNKMLTWKNRFVDLDETGKQVTPENYKIAGNEQRTYASIAIASSGLVGVGPGNSVQRDYIPHAYSDFIFAIIIEELGLIGGFVVIMLYLTLLYRCGKIAARCEDPYPAFLAMGIGIIVTTQALLHMTISVGGLVTGQPLPLVSQGGTSIIINSTYIGILLSVSRYVRRLNKKNEMATADAGDERKDKPVE